MLMIHIETMLLCDSNSTNKMVSIRLSSSDSLNLKADKCVSIGEIYISQAILKYEV